MKTSSALFDPTPSVVLKRNFHHRMDVMLRSLFCAFVGMFLIAGSLPVQALPISDPPPVEPGGTTTATADFGITGPGSFDLLLNVPAAFRLLSIYDDPSDGGMASYQRYAGAYFEATSSFNGADFTTLIGTFYAGSSGPWGFSYDPFNASNGYFGIRATDYSGGTQGFAKIKLAFEALPTTAFGLYSVPYTYSLQSGSWQDGSFNIQVASAVPEPAFGALMLAGLGALFTLRRRRRAWSA